MVRIICLLFFLFNVLDGFSQPTTIGLRFQSDNVSEGYTLFTPEKSDSAFLINNCGEILNTWVFTERPGLTCYLLENGNLLRAGKDSLEIRDWNNNLVWSYDMAGNGYSQHHDIEPLPNGNILCLLREQYTPTEISNEGRDPSNIGPNFRLDNLIELSPVGNNDADVVWEWKFIDHLIQDFDNSKNNFGVVADHPELIDLNFDNGFDSDYTHVNGIDFNPDLNQIILSTRHLHELHIIDHSTTTAEAAGHSGGNSGKGGDILWRWGNPQVYDQGTATDQKMFLQHDAKWVDAGFLDEGKISVFNNRGDGTNTFSSVHLINPDETAGVYGMYAGKFLPLDYDWTWTGDILSEPFYESKKSGTQALSNGNFMICETSKGQLTEVTKSGEIVWVYRNPVGQIVFDQYANPGANENGIFRGEKYLTTYSGFSGLTLTQNGLIEDINSESDSCNSFLNSPSLKLDLSILKSNTVSRYLEFTEVPKNIVVFSVNGQKILDSSNLNSKQVEVLLERGIYILIVAKKDGDEERHKIVVE